MKKICLVTGSRAEYGIMKPLIQRLSKDKEVNLQIIATAMHLEEKSTAILIVKLKKTVLILLIKFPYIFMILTEELYLLQWRIYN